MPRVRTGARLRLTIRVAPGRIGRVIPGISRKAAAPVEFRSMVIAGLEDGSPWSPRPTRQLRTDNLNTGDDPSTGTRMEIARQTIYRSRQYPSHVLLPVIPRGPTATTAAAAR